VSSSYTGATFTGAVYLLPTYRYDRYAAPMWALIALALLPVWISVTVAFARRMRRLSRRNKGLCESCGYDLRGSPPGGACPECGASTSADPIAPSGDELLARLR